MKYAFREPSFPLLVETDSCLIGAKSLKDLENKIESSDFQSKSSYHVIDSKGEGWSYYHDMDLISPLTVKKRWFKKEIIDLHNSFIEDDEKQFIGKSLSSKTLSILINEIVEFTYKSC